MSCSVRTRTMTTRHRHKISGGPNRKKVGKKASCPPALDLVRAGRHDTFFDELRLVGLAGCALSVAGHRTSRTRLPLAAQDAAKIVRKANSSRLKPKNIAIRTVRHNLGYAVSGRPERLSLQESPVAARHYTKKASWLTSIGGLAAGFQPREARRCVEGTALRTAMRRGGRIL